MSYKQLIGFILIVALVSIGIIGFFKEDIFKLLDERKFQLLSKQTPSESEAEEDAHDDNENMEPHGSEQHHGHHHHEENVVRLTEDQIRQLGLQIRVAGPGNLLLQLSTPGKIIIQPDHLAHIVPKISGTAVMANKNVGNFVKAEELLAVLESREMADIKAAYLAALSKQRLAASVLEREEKLYQDKVSPLQDYMNAKNAYEEANINLELAGQKLSAYGLTNQEIQELAYQRDSYLRLYQIRSPIDGTVIMRHITKGEYIENNTTIYEIADLSRVWVEIGIYPKDLYRIRQGQKVEVIHPGTQEVVQAPLIYVSPIVEEATIASKAIAELDNSQGIWRPGTFVNVNIIIGKVTVPLEIPKTAVQSSGGQDFVFIVTPEGFEKRLVKLGRSDDDNIEILSGLNPGDEYAANQTFLLKAELGKGTAEHHH